MFGKNVLLFKHIILCVKHQHKNLHCLPFEDLLVLVVNFLFIHAVNTDIGMFLSYLRISRSFKRFIRLLSNYLRFSKSLTLTVSQISLKMFFFRTDDCFQNFSEH